MFGQKKKPLSEGAKGRGVITSLTVPGPRPRLEGVDYSSVPPWTGALDRNAGQFGYHVEVRVDFDDGTTTELATKLGLPL